MRDVRRFAQWALGVGLVVAAGCGSPQTLGSNNIVLGTPGGPYPTGPYAIAMGMTVPDIQSKDGWFLNKGQVATDANMQEVDLDQFYKSTTVRWLIVDVSTGWCVFCQAEQSDLLNYIDPNNAKWGSRKIGALEIQLQDMNEKSPGLPNPAFMESWINQFNISFPIIGDVGQNFTGFAPESTFPSNWIIDTSTMQVVYHNVGYLPSDIEAKLCSLSGGC